MKYSKSDKIYNATLWVLQIIIGVIFVLSGIMKSTQGIAELSKSLPWVLDFPVTLVRFIGIAQFLGGIGLIFPALLKKKTILVVWAGLGLSLIMFFAMIYHINKGEFEAIGINILLGALTIFIAWGRWKITPLKSNK